MHSKDYPVSLLEQLEPRYLLSGNLTLSQLLESAQDLNVPALGSVTVGGEVSSEDQPDVYRFTTGAMGNLFLDLAADNSALNPLVSLYNSLGRRIRYNDNASRGTLDSFLRMRVRAGQSYYVVAEGAGETAGAYKLTATSDPRDDFGNVFATARDLRMPRSGLGRLSGTINYSGDVDMMRFVPPNSGPIEIDVSASGRGGGLYPELSVYDSGGNLIASDSGSSTSAHLALNGQGGQVYFLKVTGTYSGRRSRYKVQVNIPKDDHGNDLAHATAMKMRRSGLARTRGSIDFTGDVDMFSVVSVTTGPMQVDVSGLGRRSNLNPKLYIYDNSGTQITQAEGQSSASAMIDTVAGQRYYIKVAGDHSGRFSRYNLTAKCPKDDHGNDFAHAAAIKMRSRGLSRTRGSIDFAGDVDMFSVVAVTTGPMQVDVSGLGRRSNLNPKLYIYDNSGTQITQAEGQSSAGVMIDTVAGQTYYIKVAGDYSGRISRYNLTVKVPKDDHGNTFNSATTIRLRSLGSGRGQGNINYRGDVDIFALISPLTGEMQVDLNALGRRNNLDPEVFIYSGEGTQIAHDDDGGPGLNSSVTFDVTAGETYYIKAAAYGGYSAGRYTLSIDTEEAPPPPPAPDPEPAPEPDPDPAPGETVTAEVVYIESLRTLRVLGTSVSDIITLSSSAGSLLLSTNSGVQIFGGSFAGLLIYGFGGADTIRLTNTITTASQIYAGSGDDVIYDASSASATIDAGDGNDLLVSIGGGSDSLTGGAGLDSFWADSSDTVTDASSQETSGKTVHSITEFYQPYTTDPGSSNYVSLEIAGQNFTDPTATSYASGWNNFADVPVFVDGPQYNDVRQGSVGNCYLQAVLSSLSDTDPQVISEMITPLGDGTYAVRFFRNSQEVYLRIDADLPVNSYGSLVYAKTSPDGELWVPLVEKAFAHFRYGQNSYASMSGGWMSTTYREVTGGYTNTRWTSGSASELYNYFATHLTAGHAVTLGSYSNASSPVVGSHAYVVMSVHTSGGQQYVTVYNPWGVDGRTWDSNYYDGLLTLTIGQVQQNYSAAVTSLV